MEFIDNFFLQHPAVGSICSALFASVITIFLKSYVEDRRAEKKRLRKKKKDLFDAVYSPINDVFHGIYHRDGSCDRLTGGDVRDILAILDSNRRYIGDELSGYYDKLSDWEHTCMMTEMDGDYPKQDTEEFIQFLFAKYESLRKELYGIS